MKILVTAIMAIISMTANAQETRLLAFPTAEGFGKYASGGRGGKVVEVTNLNDSGEGSLRWALTEAGSENATIVFRVSGIITIGPNPKRPKENSIRVSLKNVTIAGQTAPGEGILLRGGKLNLGGSENVIIRNIRSRLGVKELERHEGESDQDYKKRCFIDGGAIGIENARNIIIDHCCFGWSGEENITMYDNHYTTVQWCIIHEGLHNAGHKKGVRGYGCQWGGSPASYHHNLLAHNNGRSCRFNGARNNDRVVYLDYINNVNFNYYGGSSGCHGGENTCDDKFYNGKNAGHEVNFVNNYYIKGPNTTNTRLFFVADANRSGYTSRGPSQWYVNGNVYEGEPKATEDNWSAVTIKKYSKDEARVDTLIRTKTPYWDCNADSTEFSGLYDFEMYAYAVEAFETAEEARQTVLDTVGVFPRDHVEKRIIEETRNNTYTYTGSKAGKKGIIDTPEDAEGFYDYPVVAPLTDTDRDGMPDEWEVANGCNPNVADNNVRHASGYTMLEMYLNEAMHKAPMDDGYRPQGVESVEWSTPSKKIFREGQLLIQRGDKIYTLQGQSLNIKQ